MDNIGNAIQQSQTLHPSMGVCGRFRDQIEDIWSQNYGIRIFIVHMSADKLLPGNIF